MKILFIISFIILCLLATAFIVIPWQRKPKRQWWFPVSLATVCLIFAGVWYIYMGEAAHIIYAEDDQNLKQISHLLESGTQLTPVMQQKLKEELQRQESRKSAEPTVWLLQGQLAMREEDFAAAAKAYHQAHLFAIDDPDIAINYVQALYLRNNQQVTPELSALLASVQEKYPELPGLLNLQAAIAFQAGDYSLAIKYWQELLTQYPPESADAMVLQAAIASVKERL